MAKNPNETEEIQRGNEARGLLSNPLLVSVLKEIEEIHMTQWLRTGPGETEARETAYRMLLTARTFQALLTKFVDTGNMAEKQKFAEEQQRALLDKD
jgi:hypothetical protein